MMHSKTRYSNLPSMITRSKTLLVVMSLMLIVANISTLATTRNLAKSSTDQQSQATWFLFQLTKEFSELNAVVPFAMADQTGREQVTLKYDLTWSRFDILINNKETESYMALDGTKPFFNALFERFKALEPYLIALDQPSQSKQFTSELTNIYLELVDYINTNFRIESPIYSGHMEQVQSLYRTQIILLLLLCLCAGLAGYIIHNEAQYHRQISMTDYLTKVRSRMAMFTDLERLMEHNQEFSLLLLDLNGFKQINDHYGHQAGDKALKEIANRLSQLGMPCYRIGGDEFALVTYTQDTHDAWQKIEACFQKGVDVGVQQTAYLSTSLGVAHYPSDADKLTQLISIADRNMYRMKFANGRKTASA